jgi:hypothetical protein
MGIEGAEPGKFQPPRNPRVERITSMIQVQNARATIGKYRNLTESDWNAVLEQHQAGRGLIRIEASTGRPVTFTRAEVEFLLVKSGAQPTPECTPSQKPPLENTVQDGVQYTPLRNTLGVGVGGVHSEDDVHQNAHQIHTSLETDGANDEMPRIAREERTPERTPSERKHLTSAQLLWVRLENIETIKTEEQTTVRAFVAAIARAKSIPASLNDLTTSEALEANQWLSTRSDEQVQTSFKSWLDARKVRA